MAAPKHHAIIPCSLFFILLLFAFPSTILALSEEDTSKCNYAAAEGSCYDRTKSTKLKVIAIFTILVSSMIGVSTPLLCRSLPALRPDGNLFVIVKALASGVILATGFMHVLPDSWNDLTSKCLPEKPWRVFPVTTFVAMVSTVGTMMMDTIATAYFKRRSSCGGGDHHAAMHGIKIGGAAVHDRGNGDHVHGRGHGLGHVEVEMGGAHGHHADAGGTEGHQADQKRNSALSRHRIVAQVLEVGIVVHSVVIGLSMGVSNNPCTIRPLVAAMCFHQLFEGMGLGGCILQAEYGLRIKATMVAFFSLTTPFGIALGMGLLNVYNQSSPAALIVVGVLNAVSSGLLIYMALVDLLASDFMGPKLQSSIRLQLWAYLAVLLGLGCMSLLAKWA